MTEPLKQGDKVAIVSTARKISSEELSTATSIIEGWGLKVEFGETIDAVDGQYGGPDDLRARDMQNMLDRPDIRAIFCARGGYGTVRIIDKLDFTSFMKQSKWIIGYSDITVLHSHIHRHFGVPTLHANMPITYPTDGAENESTRSIWRALSGQRLSYEWPSSEFNRKGEAEGLLVGGNLSVLNSLLCSRSDIDTDGKILFIEDLDEYLYHIDRMMINFRRSEKLSGLKGLIVGGMSNMNDNEIPFGKNALEIINEHVCKYDYPVAYGFPAGHIDDNRALIMGSSVSLNVSDDICQLNFS